MSGCTHVATAPIDGGALCGDDATLTPECAGGTGLWVCATAEPVWRVNSLGWCVSDEVVADATCSPSGPVCPPGSMPFCETEGCP